MNIFYVHEKIQDTMINRLIYTFSYIPKIKNKYVYT